MGVCGAVVGRSHAGQMPEIPGVGSATTDSLVPTRRYLLVVPPTLPTNEDTSTSDIPSCSTVYSAILVDDTHQSHFLDKEGLVAHLDSPLNPSLSFPTGWDTIDLFHLPPRSPCVCYDHVHTRCYNGKSTITTNSNGTKPVRKSCATLLRR